MLARPLFYRATPKDSRKLHEGDELEIPAIKGPSTIDTSATLSRETHVREIIMFSLQHDREADADLRRCSRRFARFNCYSSWRMPEVPAATS